MRMVSVVDCGVKLLRHLLWAAVAIAAALCLAVVAIHRGERINSVWLALAAVCSYAVAYRFYGKFLAARVLALNDQRATPAARRKFDYKRNSFTRSEH